MMTDMPDIVIAPAEILSTRLEDCDPSSVAAVNTAGALVTVLANTPHAVAVAANQIGSSVRMIAVRGPHGIISILANPTIIKRSGGLRVGNEGCLSFPDRIFKVERHGKVIVRSVNADGEHGHVVYHGFQARVIQHEIDHLDGILVDSYDPVGVPR